MMRTLTAILITLFPNLVASQIMIADIQQDVQTDFGTYHPYLVEVTPSCTLYTIESDFSNVANFDDFSFTGREEELLLQNAFVAAPSSYKEMYDIYNECRDNETPIFVTTDAMLHTYHLLYDHILKTIEKKKFVNDLKGLTDAMLSKIYQEYEAATDPVLKEALLLDVAYFSVTKSLLDTTYTPPICVSTLVSQEFDLIRAHQGLSLSPIFSYFEDYTQYKPRGHYTESDTLSTYFTAMMWYGRMTFALKPSDFSPLPDSVIREATRKALIVVHTINKVSFEGESGTDIWERIYHPTVFFVGKSDDINIYQYADLIAEVYGANFASLPVDTFANEELLDAFIERARAELIDPAISTNAPIGFRFMGQRFIPDSYVLDQLVEPYVDRALPMGLDVLSVLGSDRAYEILDEVLYQTSYAGYVTQMDSLKQEFEALPDATWAQNLYWNWLYCLMPLCFPKAAGWPIFMQKLAWQDKELWDALGSWAELRHDTILYAKQSFSFESAPPDASLTKGYVEPNPYLYARLASLANLMYTGLDNLDLIFGDLGLRLEAFEALLLALKFISEKELTNQPLTQDEHSLICGIGAMMRKLVTFDADFSEPGCEGLGEDSDDQMPVIADVHTYFNPPIHVCLEEGVGYPFNIYAVVPIDNELKVARGAIFSEYEFRQDASNRLTDEEWQDTLQTSPPDPPVWVSSFTDTTQYRPVESPTHYFWQKSWNLMVGVDEAQQQKPHILSLEGYPNPFSKTIEIRFSVPTSTTHVTLSIYDATGRLVRTLLSEVREAGEYRIAWDGKDNTGNFARNGIYFCQIKTNDLIEIAKFLLIR